MRRQLDQDENPYASPQALVAAWGDADGRFKPRLAPAGVIDLALGLLNTALVFVVVLGVPAAPGMVAQLLLPRSPWSEVIVPVILLVAYAPAFCWSVWMVLGVVQAASIDEEGIHFHRVAMRPEDWPWDELVFVRAASRWEVAWAGWLRPLLIPRERTSCMSALGHYRIQGQRDYRFFPPKDSDAFVEAIAHYRPDLLRGDLSRSLD